MSNKKNSSIQEGSYDSVIETVQEILQKGIDNGASDIHLEPTRDGLTFRFRIDGLLYLQQKFPKELMPMIISRLKVMAELDIAERRLPQDGNISFYDNHRNQEINIRVSTIPVIYGEKIVLRILNPGGLLKTLPEIGFNAENLLRYAAMLKHTWGMILVTGPAGSGKSTTIYSTIHHINSPEKNIITVEDPIECRLDNVNQIQVNLKAGLTFATALRAVLRQDPNIIMVGEIRDAETAEIAVRAALTGHLVFTTLHTGDAPRAVSRLLDMGIPPYLVNSSLVGVLSQRLLRLNCPHCREAYTPQPAEISLYHEVCGDGETPVFYRGAGCQFCSGRGYLKRTAIHELMSFDESMQELIQKTHSSQLIRKHALSQGMKPLIQDGMERAAKGDSTLTDVIKETYNSNYQDRRS